MLSPPAGLSARSLDALPQDYAIRAFERPRTGVPYGGNVPSNLTGISVSAMRLRSGSLSTRGVDSYKEFQIPIGVVEQPYVERLVVVYHNLGNWSDHFYPYLAPVLGLLPYNAANLSATELPELDIRASDRPILIKFPYVKKSHSVQQGHFSIVVEESNAPSPSPATSASGGGPSDEGHGKKNKESYTVWIVIGSLVGGCLLLKILCLLAARFRRSKKAMKIQQMELAA